MNRLEYAQFFNMLGIGIFPLHHRGKEPESKLIDGSWRKYFDTPATELDVYNWLFSGWQNYAIVCGWNNLVVIDFDDVQYFNIWELWMSDQPSYIRYAFDASFKVKTCRGVHVYVSTVEPAVNEKRIKKAGGIDIQAQRKYVVGPMSVHPSGHVYEPMNDSFIFPVIFGIETILPLDLFPAIVAEPEAGTMEPVRMAPIATEYDPFAAASRSITDMDFITRIKSVVRIEELFPDRECTSTDGRWYSARCPFHDDQRPSFWIDARRQLCGCQVCGMLPMDSINLYARMHNISESLAVTALAQEVGIWG